MTGPFFILAIASLFASGILFRHQRILTYLAVVGALFEGQWLLLTLIDRTVFVDTASSTIFLVGAFALLAVWGSQYKRWSFPYWSGVGSGRWDFWMLPVLLCTLAAAWVIFSSNGFEGLTWRSHGFFNGDTATFGALTQKSFTTDGLVQENPFAGNGPLEYPTLLHAGFATLFSFVNIGTNWLYLLPLLTYAHIAMTVPIFFLLWDVVYPKPAESWKQWVGMPARWAVLTVQAGIVLYILTLAWDTYVYPQSHFFLTGLFVLLIALLRQGYTSIGWGQFLHVIPASVISVVLLLSNAVTGTAALAALIVFFLLRSNDKKRRPPERASYLLAVVAVILLFVGIAPGEPSFGVPGFSYTAALDMVRLSPVLIALGIAVWLSLGRENFLAGAALVVAGLAFFTFIFSTRDIIVENASRFFYHALLIGFPLLLAPAIQLFYWLGRQLMYTTRTVSELVIGWATVLMLVGFALLPAGASVASAHDNLMFKDEQIVSPAVRAALWWIEDNTASDAVFLASPYPPFAIPFFTGRALLRTDYWLSPDDRVQEDVIAAFAGNEAAREQVIVHADYLLLLGEERTSWEPLPLQTVFENNEVAIYHIR